MTENRVAVVVLNWNGEKYLRRFLPSVTENLPDYARLFVADNGSTDNSLSFLSDKYPEVSVISLGSNSGYAGGYNKALRTIEADYYVLLNSDVEVTRHWIEPVIEYMDIQALVAAAQPKILSFSEKQKFEYAGASGGFIDILGFPFCRGRIFDNIESDHGQYDNSMEILWATGACMFVRAAAFWEAEGFDERFFAHMEEIDLCLRLQRIGYSIAAVPSSKVY
ncbi:MAG TPA: glycosyltransferase family 2 protein, partial [Bacteroidales bacterium]|nr:glycosyltransferase family 2 protein [Bacteroidales bacterium]